MTFHPQTDGQTKVINKMIVHILQMYNSKNPHTWDESLPYVQHNYNRAIHSSTSHNPFQVGLGFKPFCSIDVAIPFAATKAYLAHVQFEADRANSFIAAFNTSSNRSMIYWSEVMLSTSNAMINIGFHTSSRWATKFGYICRRSASLGPNASFAHSDIGHIPSVRMWGTMPSSLAFHHSLVFTECSL